MTARKYEVWLAKLDPRIGTETGKTRPVLIVQTDILNKIVCTMQCNVTVFG